jgi:PAS domain S-box-containing protein
MSRSRIRTPSASRRAARRPLRPASPQEVLRAAFEIARSSALDLEAVDAGAQFLRTLAALLPGRQVALRMIDARTLELRAMESVGSLKPGAHRQPIALKASAIRRTRLPEGITASGRVEVHSRYQTLFEESTGGFAVPIAASGELHGAINVELSAPPKRAAELLAADEQVVIPLANQLAIALRNLALLHDARRAEERLKQIVARANVYIGVVRRDGTLAMANDACLRYLGLEPDELPRVTVQSWVASTPGVPEPRLGMLILRALTGEALEAMDAWGARRDGTVQRATWSFSQLRDEAGAVDSLIIVGHDLERLRQLERQVIQAEKLSTLGQLAAGVAHELNNPLTSIGVYADYLAKRLAGEPGDAERARKIVEGAERIQRLTQGLVSYARPSMGERAPVDLNDVVAQALSFCEHVVTSSQARLETSYGPSLPLVGASRRQLQQVVINLITNAFHAMAGRSGSVRVATRRDGAQVAVVVADDGAGIAPAHRARIFEPFFTTKREGRGTGLGLSIVKNIIEAHDGTVRFESELEGGTTFIVSLPIQPSEGER